MGIGRDLTLDLQIMSGRHFQVETSCIARQCHCFFRLDGFGRVQVHPIRARGEEHLLRPCTIGIFQFKTGLDLPSGCTPPCPFSLSLARLFWGDVPSMDRLIAAARSCAFLWVYQFSTALKARSSCPSLSASPWATNGHPRIPLTLVGAMPVSRLVLAGCSRTSWPLKPFHACRPTFPFIQLLPV